MGGWWWWLGTVVIGRRGGREMWWLGSVVVGDRGLERRAVRRGGCKTQKLRFSLACSVEALFTRSECHHELAPMRAHSYVMDGGELQVERAIGKTKQQLDRVWVAPSDSPRADEVLVLIDLPIDEAGTIPPKRVRPHHHHNDHEHQHQHAGSP